jgi:endonuclease/exonuclease/phosphatase family metal-dependent hydrolase
MLPRTLATSFIVVRLACCVTTCAANELKVVSLNMDAEPSIEKVMRDFDRAPEVRGADLFLLQEVAGAADGSTSVAKDLAARLGMQFQFAPADRLAAGRMKGLAIVSRYPFHDAQILQLKRFDLHFKRRNRIAMAITVESPDGPIRVFDVHLDSRINKEQRLEQLAPVLTAAAATRLPCLIGGDFNTSSAYFVNHTIPLLGMQNQVEPVRQLMSSHGFSTPFGASPTFKHHLGLRLDWIYLRELTPAANGVANIPSSDHHAIWARVKTRE